MLDLAGRSVAFMTRGGPACYATENAHAQISTHVLFIVHDQGLRAASALPVILTRPVFRAKISFCRAALCGGSAHVDRRRRRCVAEAGDPHLCPAILGPSLPQHLEVWNKTVQACIVSLPCELLQARVNVVVTASILYPFPASLNCE